MADNRHLLHFGDCVLDLALFTLHRGGRPVAVEPQAFNLLAYLASHRDRVVSRDELLERLWAGKVVGDAALSSCVKAARQAVGDNGQTQACIATVQRRGYRFVAPLRTTPPPANGAWLPPAPDPAPGPTAPARPRVAVLPFTDLSAPAAGGALADALASDIITGLAQLRSLFVLAHGTMFALHRRGLAPAEVARTLHADYLVTGTALHRAGQLRVSTELVEVASERIVWADAFDVAPDQAFVVLDRISLRLAASIAHEIEAAERNRAVLKAPNSLDAWEAHHRGLWHAYRFSREDNALAQRFFDTAVRRDPTFASAHAGLSFTHFQNAFQNWADRPAATARALAAASQALRCDDRNPAAHLAMGRALWLQGQCEEATAALEQTIALSPSFALGHYSLAFVQAQAGDPQAAVAAADLARTLSPYDPLLFGMLGARAIALVRLGEFGSAAHWASQAAARPNAHVHIQSVAACTLALAGRLDEARQHLRNIHEAVPGYRLADFLAAFHFDADGRALFQRGALAVGMA